MSHTDIITGNYAVAYATRTAEVGVIAAYPITPQTTVIEKISEFVSNNELNAEFILVESEHSAMAACIAASATGVRTFTATAAHGLALMHEGLHWAARSRLPIVLANVNRSMGPSWNIWPEHTDSMAQRDTGMIQIYVSNNQEIYDTILQMFRLSETSDILLPSMVCLDGFILSHAYTPVEYFNPEEIRDFLPPYDPPHWKLDPLNPGSVGNMMPSEEFYKFSHSMDMAHNRALKLYPKIEEEYRKLSGRYHGGPVDCYRCEDAEHIVLAAGTIGEESRVAVDNLRKEGKRVGLGRVRLFRPFPKEEYQRLAANVASLTIIDRSITYGYEGPICTEVKAALYDLPDRPCVSGYILGLGGVDVKYLDVQQVINHTIKLTEKHVSESPIYHGPLEKEV